jgi:mRNA interferase RelE/StbE
MEGGAKQHIWALVLSPDYVEEQRRLVPKFRSQVARKAQDLASDPRPGGSRTALKGYDGLYRVRAGRYRIIYAFNDDVVQLLTLRWRDDRTYDKLDELEVAQLESFRSITCSSKGSHDVAQWEELAKQWAAPKPRPAEPLPQPITEAMLEELKIPVEHRATLLAAKGVDELLDCDVPAENVHEVLNRLCPRRSAP